MENTSKAIFMAVLTSRKKVMLVVGFGSIFLLGIGYFLEYVVALHPVRFALSSEGFSLEWG